MVGIGNAVSPHLSKICLLYAPYPFSLGVNCSQTQIVNATDESIHVFG